MNPPAIERLFLDFDRTLLDTDMFTHAVFGAVESIFAIPAVQLASEVKDYYMYHGALQYYDFFAHVTALGLDPQVVEDEVRTFLMGGDYLFPDAHELLRFIAATGSEAYIVSFGPSNYQQFKYSVVRELQPLPLVTVLEDKSAYLAAQPPRSSLLVDDKPVKPLPEWCAQYIIDRKASQDITQEASKMWRIKSLQSVESAMSVGYNEPNQKGTSDAAD
jgi:hypothetical protein